MQSLLSVLVIGAWIFAFIDVLVTDRAAARTLPKWAWIGLILVLPPVGVIGWWLFGRPARPATGASGSSRPVAQPSRERPAPLRRPRPPTRAQRAEEEAELRASIEERDRLIAQWAEEDRRRTSSGGEPD